MCILLNINSNILSNHYIQYYVMNFFRAKASPSKQATVAFPGLNYDITRFASIFRVGNGYCGINIEKNTFRTGQFNQKPDKSVGFLKKANRFIGFLVKYIYISQQSILKQGFQKTHFPTVLEVENFFPVDLANF